VPAKLPALAAGGGELGAAARLGGAGGAVAVLAVVEGAAAGSGAVLVVDEAAAGVVAVLVVDGALGRVAAAGAVRDRAPGVATIADDDAATGVGAAEGVAVAASEGAAGAPVKPVAAYQLMSSNFAAPRNVAQCCAMSRRASALPGSLATPMACQLMSS
jgi:hypothetical protein